MSETDLFLYTKEFQVQILEFVKLNIFFYANKNNSAISGSYQVHLCAQSRRSVHNINIILNPGCLWRDIFQEDTCILNPTLNLNSNLGFTGITGSCPLLRGAEPCTHLLGVEGLRPVVERHFGLFPLDTLLLNSHILLRTGLQERCLLILSIRVVFRRHLICEYVDGGKWGQRAASMPGNGSPCWLGGEHQSAPFLFKQSHAY